MNRPALDPALEAFVAAHRRHGPLAGDATGPMLSGSRAWITCPCGARFDWWVTAGESVEDVARAWRAVASDAGGGEAATPLADGPPPAT